MRSIEKFISHVVNNSFPLNEYSDAEVKRLVKMYQDEADEKNIEIDDKLLAKYIQQYDNLKNGNHPEIKDREIRHWPLQKLIKLVAKYVDEDEGDWDPGLETVYEEGPISIWNGSEEDRCVKYAKDESPWCIGKGSFIHYRTSKERGYPTFYLCRNRDLANSNRLSFVAVQVRDPQLKPAEKQYVYTNRRNDPHESQPMSWEQLLKEVPWLAQVPNIKNLLKPIPLSPGQKRGTELKGFMTISQFMQLPLNYKKQYLINREQKSDKFSDIGNKTFIEDYLVKVPPLMDFVATNAGVLPAADLFASFEKLDKQNQKSVLANFHTKLESEELYKSRLPWKAKQLIAYKGNFDTLSNSSTYFESIYLTDNDKVIAHVKSDDDGNSLKLGYVAEDEEHRSVKLTKNTAKYLVDCPIFAKDSDQPLSLELIAKIYGLNQGLNETLDGKLEAEASKRGEEIEKVEKDDVTYYVDTDAGKAFKKEKYSFKEVPFDEVEAETGSDASSKSKKKILDTLIKTFKEAGRVEKNYNPEATTKFIDSLPYDERTIQNDNIRRSGVILVDFVTPILFTKPIKASLYMGMSYDFQRKNVYTSDTMKSPQWEAYFKYLKDINQGYDQYEINSLVRAIDGSSRNYESFEAFVNSDPPLNLPANVKFINYEGEVYYLDADIPNNSYKISPRSYKKVKTGLNARKFAELTRTAPEPTPEPEVQAEPEAQAEPQAQVQQTTPPGEQAENRTGFINVGVEFRDYGLLDSVRQLPRPVLTRLNVDNAYDVEPNFRAATARTTALGNIGSVFRVTEVQNKHNRLFWIRLNNEAQTVICSIRTQQIEYVVLPSGSQRVSSFTDILPLLGRNNLAEVTKKDIIRAMIAEQVINHLESRL